MSHIRLTTISHKADTVCRCGNGHGMTEHTVQAAAAELDGYAEVQALRAKKMFRDAGMAEYKLYEEVVDRADVLCVTAVSAGARSR
eukprot:3794231-Pyramimonas_sp.AAC.2